MATFPVSLATLINMTILVCAPAWGHGMATFAWVLWWIDSVLALTTCVHLTFVMRVLPFLHLYLSNELLPASPVHATDSLTSLIECQTGEASWRR